MISWNEFKAAVDSALESIGATADVKLRYIDSGGYVSGEQLSIDIESTDEAGRPTEVSIWS